MTIDKQLAWIGAWLYHHQSDAEATEVLEGIKKSLKRLKASDAERLVKGKKPKYVRFKEFIEVYDTFCKKEAGVGARMNATQGAAMNKIIAYLVSQSNTNNEEGALLAWSYILSHWKNLTDFIKRQTALTQINKNLVEILTQLRNHGKSNSKGSSAADDIRNAAR